jgi:hypothetical protein
VDGATVREQAVVGVTVRLEVRLFFTDDPAAVVMAPPDGLEPPTQALGRLRSIH